MDRILNAIHRSRELQTEDHVLSDVTHFWLLFLISKSEKYVDLGSPIFEGDRFVAPTLFPPQQPWRTSTKTQPSEQHQILQTQISPTRPKISVSYPPSPSRAPSPSPLSSRPAHISPEQQTTLPSPAAAKKTSNTMAPSPKPIPSLHPATLCTTPSPSPALTIQRTSSSASMIPAMTQLPSNNREVRISGLWGRVTRRAG